MKHGVSMQRKEHAGDFEWHGFRPLTLLLHLCNLEPWDRQHMAAPSPLG